LSRVSETSIDELVAGVARADLRSVARVASLIENRTERGRELVRRLFSSTGHALTIGITGPPGAGKSTLVNRLAEVARSEGKRIGIIAVDPSSPFTQGAILGDRVRMQQHHGDPDVFIRSMATRGRLGGVAESTFEMSLLLDAAKFDLVLIETVGVGQDEVEISRLADITVVVLVPGLGDDVQAIKAGLMEVADIFAVNKADLPGAEKVEHEVRAMQGLADASEAKPVAPVSRVIAADGTGVAELLENIREVASRKLQQQRPDVWEHRLRELLVDRILSSVKHETLRRHAQLVAAREEDPFTAIDRIWNESAKWGERA
jgi:LAO/AO transport system kinase